ncbi:exo-alpha-sialidase [Mucilaginibacter sp. 14171R-50]|uniref:WD40/YVTN/BNR-like repeat-containing protein n=1 Tax=Mucilaginibacter sp. 14171R-50 TaxID=2703789 RepID=UPI00138CFA99|nr:exo-alpha-sialidase [Mucilaginibacter sp. 14171R-50]QHS56934.1 exo-alpha-sialidase [Mucilaginibacter sp. 14171R-50]
MKNQKMKRLSVLVPAIPLVLFLLNSFVLKENKTGAKITEGTKSGVLNIVYRSTDGGQTWLNISEGLPESLQRSGVWNGGLVANNRGLYIRAANGLFYDDPNSKTFFWTKEIFPGKQRNITAGNNGILAYDIRGQFMQKINGADNWVPAYTNFQEQAVRIDKTMDWMYKNFKEREVRTVFETSRGTILVGSSNSLFRSANGGTSWKQLHVGDGRMKFVELNGVLLTTSKNGILRSTDDGESWDRVISEGGLGIAVEPINGGFAAIVYNPVTKINTLHISLDDGKTWNATGKDLLPSWNNLLMKKMGLVDSTPEILSIKQMGKYLICGRTDGIFRSSDLGKTWSRLELPAVENKGFNLSVSGTAIYIFPNKGC